MSVSNVISLLSGIALFLFGMSLMGDGLKKVAGSKLELILFRLSNTPLKGMLLGTGVTAVIQSSSATSVMVVGFVNSGMMKVRQAIGIVLGAILGTSITGWILCLSSLSGGSGWVELLSTASIAGIVAVAGILLRMICKDASRKHVGDILLGFSVLMFGMQAMSGAVAPLRSNPAFTAVLTSFSQPLLGILAGCVITCILQSASASVGILQALAATGAVTFDTALPLIMGIAIGAAVPVLLSAVGASAAGKRTAFVYLLADVLGAAVWSVVFYSLNGIFHFPFTGGTYTMNAVSIAFVNTLFRLATLLLLAPFTGLLEKLVCRLFRDKSGYEEEIAEIDRLEDRFLAHPAIAVEQSGIAMTSMCRKSAKNLYRSFKLLNDYSDEYWQRIQDKEDIVDRYEDRIGTYLIKLTGRELTHEQNQLISLYLHTISDFERISDHAVNLSDAAKEIHQKKLSFSPEAKAEVQVLMDAVREIVTLTSEAFMELNVQKALRVEPLEDLIDALCDEVKLRHVQRIQSGDCTLEHGFVFNDLLTNLERVADHCSNVAVAMIELSDEVFDTHSYLNGVKNVHSKEFDACYEEYSKRFTLAPASEDSAEGSAPVLG